LCDTPVQAPQRLSLSHSLATLSSRLQNQRFKAMSDTILSRIDEMGGRIEELEKSINDLTTQTSQGAGSDAPAPSASS